MLRDGLRLRTVARPGLPDQLFFSQDSTCFHFQFGSQVGRGGISFP